MYVIDTYCDALLKLQTDFRNTYLYKERSIEYLDTPKLESNMNRRIAGGVKVQFYAIFISPLLPDNEKWQHALEQIDRFHKDILTQKHMVHIKNFKEIKNFLERFCD
ncbi:membrane dipeptidase [Phocicoccus pinnipedialis]|uniref:Membrane dipeptidase (Peptidase family M19) n=1 Tax=Phocicoccus pinnipedialis TaxID=110845 RepID=A0A6V7RD79_9BACL|nr:membrane dipeptidase [Jeotgalicoccus pinnipedialis]MBP1939528.1 microsomal dipeptidase-like Zn-dependent dipeptidase [Jeotgalicoccus pinnipedialis]CAD2075017.1 Membrane dipeptidase (Peptidase family M19) [Jeotgalicoccus pinnipedialis]